MMFLLWFSLSHLVVIDCFRPNQRLTKFDRLLFDLHSSTNRQDAKPSLHALSSKYLENDIVAIEYKQDCDEKSSLEEGSQATIPRLCVVGRDGIVAPLCQHEDDVETDLFVDPRCVDDPIWELMCDEHVTKTYGEGWYGQRPVPSLGGGPGYVPGINSTMFPCWCWSVSHWIFSISSFVLFRLNDVKLWG